MNDSINKIDSVFKELKRIYSNMNIIVLAPGDTIESSELDMWNSERAIEQYDLAYNDLNKRTLEEEKSIEVTSLKKSAADYSQRSIKLHQSQRIKKFEKMLIGVYDTNTVYSFDFNTGLLEWNGGMELADIGLTSDVLKYTFDNNWGFDTLLVSGLFQKPSHGNFENVKQYVFLAELMNKGERFGGYFQSFKRRLIQLLK
ncbi:MAG: hypothetical protein IPG89_22035 [Bacteroidetes bacterium]|nr:hypothetical protein [Bacteroidota bacterium]